jgi:hypothetical protein
MSSGAENAQVAVECNLAGLSVWKPRAKAAPVESKISAEIDTIIGSRVKRAGRGGVIDLERPYRQIGKGAASYATDVSPGYSAINSLENMTKNAKPVDHGIGCEGVGGINLDVIDPAAELS